MTSNGLLLELKSRDEEIAHTKSYISGLEEETGRLKLIIKKLEASRSNEAITKKEIHDVGVGSVDFINSKK